MQPEVEEMVGMKNKLIPVMFGLAVALLAAGTGASAASFACPDSAATCRPAKPDAGPSAKSPTARPKIAPVRVRDAFGQEAWQSGSWLMQ